MHDLHFSWQGAGHAQCVTRVQRKRQKKKKKKRRRKSNQFFGVKLEQTVRKRENEGFRIVISVKNWRVIYVKVYGSINSLKKRLRKGGHLTHPLTCNTIVQTRVLHYSVAGGKVQPSL
jgi:hypothetical protein